MLRTVRNSFVILPACLILVSVAWGQQEADKTGVYRLQPGLEGAKRVAVEKSQVRPGFAYNYFHEGLQKRVWGFATASGGFEYAFGVGTLLPTSRFDFQISEDSQSQILSERAPGLKEYLSTVGRSPAVRLTATGDWQLLPFPVSERVFDMATGRRWEWHGKRRLAVLHTNGYLWTDEDGKFIPLAAGYDTCQCGHPIGLPSISQHEHGAVR